MSKATYNVMSLLARDKLMSLNCNDLNSTLIRILINLSSWSVTAYICMSLRSGVSRWEAEMQLDDACVGDIASVSSCMNIFKLFYQHWIPIFGGPEHFKGIPSDFISRVKIRKDIIYRRDMKKVKVKWSRYRPGVAQRVGRGIALFFHDRGTSRWWVVSSTPRPHFTPGKDPVPIL